MELKKKVEELVEKLKNNPQLMEKFKADPVNALKGIMNIDLPDDQIKSMVAGIKAKLGADDVSETIGKIKKLF